MHIMSCNDAITLDLTRLKSQRRGAMGYDGIQDFAGVVQGSKPHFFLILCHICNAHAHLAAQMYAVITPEGDTARNPMHRCFVERL